MIDNKYNDSYDYIYEEFLDENIPRDLLSVYNLRPYISQRNPSTQHSEILGRSRRSKLYDYGNATYKVISAEEALQLIKQNKYEVQNLRIIFDDNLVEYEVRDNDSIYPIYRTAYPVFLNGKEYKNVGFAPWQAVIRAAKKIYWTDEYSRKLSPEQIAIRDEKDAQRIIYKGLTPQDISYNPHRPYDNLIRGKQIKQKAIPDTGAHVNIDYQTQTFLQHLYIEYDLARKAVKKLELEKDVYDEEEYEDLKRKLEKIMRDALEKYNNALDEKRIEDTKKVKEISLYTHKFNTRLAEYTKAIQTCLADSYDLKKKLDALLITTVNTDSEAHYILRILRENILDLIKDLKDDKEKLEDSQHETNNGNDEEISQLLASIETYKKNYITKHVHDLTNIETQMKEIEDLIATYRPHTAARKARNLAANTKQLDPDLVDIIDFGDFNS